MVTERPRSPLEFRITWANARGEVDEVVTTRKLAAVLLCRIWAHHGQDHPVTIGKRRLGEGGWISSDWRDLVTGLFSHQRRRLEQLPGWPARGSVTPVTVDRAPVGAS